MSLRAEKFHEALRTPNQGDLSNCSILFIEDIQLNSVYPQNIADLP